MRPLHFVAAVAAIVGLVRSSANADPPPIASGISIRLQERANFATAVNWGTHANDGSNRFFVETQSGIVRLFKNGSLVPAPFLDIPSVLTIQAGGEKGLLGMAFHPNFGGAVGTPGQGKLYTYTSEGKAGTPDFTHPELGAAGGDHHSVIREWTVDAANPDRIDTSITPREVMRIVQPQSNHNGGGMVFDTGGNLYIALGDGGGSNDNNGGINNNTDGHTNGTGNGQDISNVYGKILRVNPLKSGANNFTVPASNPFAGATPGEDTIYAYGLRNPFRISFDRQTGVLYAGDVGQGEREEVDIIESGKNYGWVYREGTRDNRAGGPTGTIDPIAEYTHADGVAVIGGFVYRGSAMPALVGKYVFGELNGRLFYTEATGGVIHELGFVGGALTGGVNGFGEDQQGEIYAMLGGGGVMALTRLAAQWNVNAAGNWTTAGNWSGGVPNAAGELATFGTIITAPRIVTVNQPQTIGAILFDNSNAYTLGGTGKLTLDNAGMATIEVANGSHTISAPIGTAAGNNLTKTGPGTLTLSGAQTHAAGTILTVAAGTLNLNSDAGANTAVVANATTHFGASQHLAGLAVGPAATARLDAGGNRILRTFSLAIAGTGVLDLTDNDLIVQAAAGNEAAVLAAITAQIKTGSAGFPWNGPGINSSTAAAVSRTAIGVMRNSNGMGGTYRTLFSGEVVDSQSILVKYTYTGDADLSGAVDGTDYALIDNGFNSQGQGWFNGDFDYSGAIDGTDYALIDNAYNSQGAPLVGASPSAVPEPSTGAMAVCIGAALVVAMRYRWRA